MYFEKFIFIKNKLLNLGINIYILFMYLKFEISNDFFFNFK